PGAAGETSLQPFLEQLAWQEEPMARWEELTPEAQFLTQVQALDVAMEKAGGPIKDFSEKMGLGRDGLGQALGMATGLAAKAYDPDRWARLNLPEHLEGHKDLNWGEISYNQDGYLTEDGLRLERLEGSFSSGTWGSVAAGQYSPYPEVVHRTLRLELAQVSLGTGMERMQSQERWQYSARHRWKATTWGLEGYTQRGSEDYGLDFLLRGPRWTTEISQYRRTQTTRGRRLLIARRGRVFSPQVELIDPGRDIEKDLRIGWTSAPLGNLTWEISSLSGYLSGISRLRQLSSVISGRGESVSGRLRGHYRKGAGSIGQATILIRRDRARWTLGTSFNQRRSPSITEGNILLSRDWAGWLSSTVGMTYRPFRAPEDDQILLSCSAHLRPESATVIHLRFEGDSEQKRHITWGMGLDRWGAVSWGGGWADEWTPEGRRRWRLSAHGGLINSGGAGIRGRAEIELTSGGEAEAYEIEIQQLGHSCSPGLLFTKNPLTGVRNDGFIRFRF
ncbi:hypothetical protein ACFL0G_04190, partial [Candidatus Zixiibacteriota bacterium]